MENLLKTLYNRIFVHYYSTLRGILYAGLIVMYFTNKITGEQFLAMIGGIMALKAFIDKDPDKIESKKDFKTN